MSMQPKICISGSVGYSSNCGGQAWLYVDLALGFQALGYEVVFLTEWGEDTETSAEEFGRIVGQRLSSMGLNCTVGLRSSSSGLLARAPRKEYLLLEEFAAETELYLNMGYLSEPEVVSAFATSVYLDTDPGVFQLWLEEGAIDVAEHDVYLTISPTIAAGNSKVPNCGIDWQFVPPAVSPEAWRRPRNGEEEGTVYTTVSNWWGADEWIEWEGRVYSNEKRTAFLRYIDLPRRSKVPLELALTLGPWETDRRQRQLLEERGWRVKPLPPPDARSMEWTPNAYRSYVRSSRGEWSCAKPLYRELRTGVIFNRTLHYLASGLPAIVEDTGPVPLLEGWDRGLLRFKSIEEAHDCIDRAEAAYDVHREAARELVRSHFDAREVARTILEVVRRQGREMMDGPEQPLKSEGA